MLHPSYSDLMKVVNSEVEQGDTPVVNSRYSIVMATAKRARQIAAQAKECGIIITEKPVKTAINEIASGKVIIVESQEQD